MHPASAEVATNLARWLYSLRATLNDQLPIKGRAVQNAKMIANGNVSTVYYAGVQCWRNDVISLHNAMTYDDDYYVAHRS